MRETEIRDRNKHVGTDTDMCVCVVVASILDASLHLSVYVGLAAGVGHTGGRLAK